MRRQTGNNLLGLETTEEGGEQTADEFNKRLSPVNYS